MGNKLSWNYVEDNKLQKKRIDELSTFYNELEISNYSETQLKEMLLRINVLEKETEIFVEELIKPFEDFIKTNSKKIKDYKQNNINPITNAKFKIEYQLKKIIRNKENNLLELITKNNEKIKDLNIKYHICECKHCSSVWIISNFYLNNISFSITGTVSQEKDLFEKIINNNGGIYNHKLTKDTDFLIVGKQVGDRISEAMKKANLLNIEMISELEFFKIIEKPNK